MNEWQPSDLKSNLDGGKNVFLKLWKKGCGPCKLSEPAVERLEQQKKDSDIVFAQICIDDYPEMLEISESEILPAFFYFKAGKLSTKQIGFKGLAKLVEMVG